MKYRQKPRYEAPLTSSRDRNSPSAPRIRRPTEAAVSDDLQAGPVSGHHVGGGTSTLWTWARSVENRLRCSDVLSYGEFFRGCDPAGAAVS
jgi:hypothetical protein